jgi:hypothetical protein
VTKVHTDFKSREGKEVTRGGQADGLKGRANVDRCREWKIRVGEEGERGRMNCMGGW